MANATQLPTYSTALVDAGGRSSGEYYRFFQSINTNLVNYNALDARVTALEDQVPPVPSDVLGLQSIHSFGHLSEGIVRLSFVGDVDKPGNTYVYGTDDTGTKGWQPLFSSFATSTLALTKAATTNLVTYDLAALADSGVGAALVKITRDTYGRISGTHAATTDDLTEGPTNLYFTAARVLSTILAGLSTATSAVITASDTVLSGLGKLQAQISAFGTMAQQNANAVAITGGTINGTTLGATTPASGAFTTLSSMSDATINNVTVGLGPGSATSNLVFGAGAFAARTTASNCIAIGANAMAANSTLNSNLAIGSGALGAMTIGTGNLAVGAQAGGFATSVLSSVLIGGNAGLGSSSIGISSAVAIGNGAMQAGGGTQPVAIGVGALASMTSSQGSVAVGYNALNLLTSGTGSVGIGFSAGSKQTSGAGNIYIGFQSGVTGTTANANVTGTGNVYIGYNSGPATATQLSNSVAIGLNAVCTASNQIILGGSAVTDSRVNGNWSVQTAGSGLRVAEGSNCKQGVATLAAGSVVVANTKVTATSRIILTGNADGGTPGWVRVSARTAGTSFTITSSSATDTSTIAYQIFEPA